MMMMMMMTMREIKRYAMYAAGMSCDKNFLCVCVFTWLWAARLSYQCRYRFAGRIKKTPESATRLLL